MHPSIRSLLILQDRDQRIQSLQTEINTIPTTQQKLQEQLTHHLTIIERAEKQTSLLELQTSQHEADLTTRTNTLQRLQQQLSESHKLQEIHVFESEIERYQKEIEAAESLILTKIEQTETQREKITNARQNFSRLQHQTQQQIQVLEQKKSQLLSQLQDAQIARDTAAQPIPSTELSLYNALLKTKNNPITPVHHGQCNGCHMKLVASTFVNVQNSKEITTCENCGRILYTDSLS